MKVMESNKKIKLLKKFSKRATIKRSIWLVSDQIPLYQWQIDKHSVMQIFPSFFMETLIETSGAVNQVINESVTELADEHQQRILLWW